MQHIDLTSVLSSDIQNIRYQKLGLPVVAIAPGPTYQSTFANNHSSLFGHTICCDLKMRGDGHREYGRISYSQVLDTLLTIGLEPKLPNLNGDLP